MTPNYPLRTAGQLKKSLEHIPDDTPLRKPRHFKVVKAHYIDGIFHSYHYNSVTNGVEMGCCRAISSFRNEIHQLIDVIIFE